MCFQNEKWPSDDDHLQDEEEGEEEDDDDNDVSDAVTAASMLSNGYDWLVAICVMLHPT